MQDRSKTHKAYWVQSLRQQQLKPLIEILEVVEEAVWEDAERFWIAYLRFLGCRLTNQDSGGRNDKRRSPETCRLISSRLKGRPGRKQPPEEIAKRRAARLGHKASPETRARISAAKKGKGHPHTDESRKKISIANQGKRRSAESRAKMTGRKFSAEHIANIVASWKTRKRYQRTPEHTAKLVAVHAARRAREASLRQTAEAGGSLSVPSSPHPYPSEPPASVSQPA